MTQICSYFLRTPLQNISTLPFCAADFMAVFNFCCPCWPETPVISLLPFYVRFLMVLIGRLSKPQIVKDLWSFWVVLLCVCLLFFCQWVTWWLIFLFTSHWRLSHCCTALQVHTLSNKEVNCLQVNNNYVLRVSFVLQRQKYFKLSRQHLSNGSHVSLITLEIWQSAM